MMKKNIKLNDSTSSIQNGGKRLLNGTWGVRAGGVFITSSEFKEAGASDWLLHTPPPSLPNLSPFWVQKIEDKTVLQLIVGKTALFTFAN